MVNLTLSSVNGLRDTVALSTANVPTGIGTVLGKSIVVLGPPFVTVSLELSASSTMLQGDYYSFDVNAITSHGLSRAEKIYVDVTQPVFSFSTNPSLLSLGTGSAGNTSLFFYPFSSFAGTIDLIAMFTLQPPGATLPLLSLSPVSVPLSSFGAKGSTLTVTTSTSTSSGFYRILVVGTARSSPDLRESILIELRIGLGFELTAQPQFPVVNQCSSGSVTVTVTSVQGFAGPVMVTSTWDVFSPSLRPILNPTSRTVMVAPGSPGNYNLSFTATLDNYPSSDYSVDLTGTSGYQMNITSFRITVQTIAGAPGLTLPGLDPALYLLVGAVILASVAIIVVLKRRAGKESLPETADFPNRPSR